MLEKLCRLTRSDNVSLRLNGVWALMNLTYQADLNLKNKVLSILGIDQIFHLLSDSNVNILMKTLGLMRNMISNKQVSLVCCNNKVMLILFSSLAH